MYYTNTLTLQALWNTYLYIQCLQLVIDWVPEIGFLGAQNYAKSGFGFRAYSTLKNHQTLQKCDKK